MNLTISFNLNQQLDANYILNRIGELVRSAGDPKDKILVISIKTVEQEAIMLPLLEYKEWKTVSLKFIQLTLKPSTFTVRHQEKIKNFSNNYLQEKIAP